VKSELRININEREYYVTFKNTRVLLIEFLAARSNVFAVINHTMLLIH